MVERSDDKHGEVELPEGCVFLCRASGEGSHDFHVARNEAEVMAFYKEMWGEDQDGGIQSQIDHFRDFDQNWTNSRTAYSCDLYCSTFQVWIVDAAALSARSHEAATDSLNTGMAAPTRNPAHDTCDNCNPSNRCWDDERSPCQREAVAQSSSIVTPESQEVINYLNQCVEQQSGAWPLTWVRVSQSVVDDIIKLLSAPVATATVHFESRPIAPCQQDLRPNAGGGRICKTCLSVAVDGYEVMYCGNERKSVAS